LETDSTSKDLAEIVNFCSEFGGYPVYALNAYEWQIVQGMIHFIYF
jgi:hypothetical protein